MVRLKEKEEHRFWCRGCSEVGKDYYFNKLVYGEGMNTVRCPKCDNFVETEW